jgi:hypothetical protein
MLEVLLTIALAVGAVAAARLLHTSTSHDGTTTTTNAIDPPDNQGGGVPSIHRITRVGEDERVKVTVFNEDPVSFLVD